MSQNSGSNNLDPSRPPFAAADAYCNELEGILEASQLEQLQGLGLHFRQIEQLGLLLLLLKSGDGRVPLLTNYQGHTPLDLVDSPAVRRFIQVIS
jgi:hypothetical protein